MAGNMKLNGYVSTCPAKISARGDIIDWELGVWLAKYAAEKPCNCCSMYVDGGVAASWRL